MTIRNLNLLFKPSSLALVGASEREGSIGLHIAENLLRGGFQGEIGFVNPGRDTILGKPCSDNIETLPFVPGLAVVATPPKTVPGIIAELGHKGCRAAVVITAGLTGDLTKSMLEAAEPLSYAYHRPQLPWHPDTELESGRELRAHTREARRHRACVSIGRDNGGHARLGGRRGRRVQSRRLDRGRCRRRYRRHARLSRGRRHEQGRFSLHRGDQGCGEVHVRGKALLARQARDRHQGRPAPEGARAAASHTGALAGSDNVYGAAFRRAGILRVVDLDEMFDAAEVLARVKCLPGSRLAIVTNGGGAGVIAADTLADLRGTLSNLEPGTIEALNKVLPPTWSHGNLSTSSATRARIATAQRCKLFCKTPTRTLCSS